MVEQRKLKVFLCHSSGDKPEVRKLYRYLISAGFDAWLDEEKLLPGQNWDLEIRKAVRESDVVVVCLSKTSITKEGYIQKEIRMALDIADEKPDETIFLIPERLEECNVPDRLAKWQWGNLFDENGYQKLESSLMFRAEKLKIKISSFAEPQMIYIPFGKFLMGSTVEQAQRAVEDGMDEAWVNDEQPQHEVLLSEYSISSLVTNSEYFEFIKAVGWRVPGHWNDDWFPLGKANHPVVNVSYDDAKAYCDWLSNMTRKNYHLPTEAEWEKAVRGVDGRVYPYGDVHTKQNDSPYGCSDLMSGILEWCSDWYGKDEYKRHNTNARDPKGPIDGTSRVIRGGTYEIGRWSLRCAFRSGGVPETLNDLLGFRVVLSYENTYSLTPLEKQILTLMKSNLRDEDIMRELSFSREIVNEFVSNIIRKLHGSNRDEAIEIGRFLDQIS